MHKKRNETVYKCTIVILHQSNQIHEKNEGMMYKTFVSEIQKRNIYV